MQLRYSRMNTSLDPFNHPSNLNFSSLFHVISLYSSILCISVPVLDWEAAMSVDYMSTLRSGEVSLLFMYTSFLNYWMRL